MTLSATAVAKRLAGDGNEFPVITGRMERELEHAVSPRVAHLTVEFDRADFVKPYPAGPALAPKYLK